MATGLTPVAHESAPKLSVALAFTVLLVIGVPISLVLALSAAIYIALTDNWVLFLTYPRQMFDGLNSYGLLALPLFMLVGEVMEKSGITKRLIDMATAFVGALKGGLAYINVLANMFIAAILGSTLAQIAIMSRAIVPEMERAGYDKSFSVATTAAAGMLSPVIPPSMLFVIYGVVAQISIGDMFVAGIIPGLMMTAAFFAVIAVLGLFYRYPTLDERPLRLRLKLVLSGLPAALVPLVIVGSILGGIATPTESAAVAALAAALIGRFVYRELALADLWPALVRTAMTSAMVLMLVPTAKVFGWVITFEQVPHAVAELLQSLTSDPIVFLLLVNLGLLFVGMVIEAIAALIIVVPILLPIAVNVYGIDPVHFGVVICINLIMGLLTPPVGAGLFVSAAVSGLKPERIMLALWPFLLATVVVLLLLILERRLTTVLLE
ncbi:MAG: TRAP transporter large permease [Kiloniellales bacterium]|nr:TRAP transporter large permease [Kiloniellales bacterium]